jgi:hypothetical protein
MAAWAPSENIVKKRANSWNTGFPGGCPTSSLYDDAINSPQSQKDADGSIVERYVKADMAKTTNAVIRFHKENFLSVITHKDTKGIAIFAKIWPR